MRGTGFQRQAKQLIAQQTQCSKCIGKELKGTCVPFAFASCPCHHPLTAQALPTRVRTIKSRQVRRPIPPSHLILRCGFPPLSNVNFYSASFSKQLPACQARLQTQIQLQHQSRCQGYLVSFFPRHSSPSFPPKPAAPSRPALETLPLELTV